MKLELYTKSEKKLYEATATFLDGKVMVHKGSRINLTPGNGYKPNQIISKLRKDSEYIDQNGVMKKDITFNSLSMAASFVQGRSANGMISWKTENGKCVREILKKK